ncbi:MAG: hypothetical protein KDA33_15730 [Phycisphaerales bacterium]|nr:hypothetical protein [Phycisphaerales bacterium]
MTTEIRTKRELCGAIEELIARQEACDRTLESYLLAALDGIAMFSDRESLRMTEFLALIESGFARAPAAFDEGWRREYDRLSQDEDTCAGCRATIVRQIVDLHEMDECGKLLSEWREFGIDAPRGERWFNFEPVLYLRCALAGTFGQWEPGEDLAPSVDQNSSIMPADADSGESGRTDETTRLKKLSPAVSWERVHTFFICGQICE